jgi:NADH-quinone oxidoreductase subunit G
VPGSEADVLSRLAGTAGPVADDDLISTAAQALGRPGSVILAGERLAEVPGALSAAATLAEATGARLAWIPRRAGERGAIEAGALPVLLPGGRLVSDAAARSQVARAWGTGSLPAEPGRNTGQILDAVTAGEVEALVVAGVDPADLPDPQAALDSIERAGFVVSLELRASPVTDRADVVFPVAAVSEKAGTFVNWEGRPGEFDAALSVPGIGGDLHVLAQIADAMDIHLGLPDAAAARRELASLGAAAGPRPGLTSPAGGRPAAAVPGAAEALLATWHNLLDAGRMQDGEPHLAGTARQAVARMSAATAAEAGVSAGAKVSVATSRGEVCVPVEITAMPDRVVWLPTNSAGCSVRRDLGAGHGSLVRLSAPGEHPRAAAGRSAE